MRTIIFGNPFFAARTQRALGGEFYADLENKKLEEVDTFFIESGALTRKKPVYSSNKASLVVGPTYEEPQWKNYFANGSKTQIPKSRSFFLNAAAIKKFNKAKKSSDFWSTLQQLNLETLVEPELRNWFYPQLRVLQVVTSLHVGGAERVCLELSKMPECLGIVSWGQAKKTALSKPHWDFSNLAERDKTRSLLELATSLHVDLIHTHLLTAQVNRELEKHFPLLTTIHNTTEGWPQGYATRNNPGTLVACSKGVAAAFKEKVFVAWNGISLQTPKPVGKRSSKEIAIISVANFRGQKRLHKIPAILKQLKRMGFKPTFRLIGELHPTSIDAKRSFELFQKEVEKFKLQKKIQIIQTLDVKSELARSDVFLSVSAHEGMSLSQLEALAAGLPVVSTEVGGSEEIAREVKEQGYLVLPVKAKVVSFAKEIIKAKNLPKTNRLPKSLSAESMRIRYRILYYRCLTSGISTNQIWFITNNFSMGGAQSSAKRLLQHLSAKGQNVRAFTLQENQPSLITEELLADDIKVRNLSGANSLEKVYSLLKMAAVERPKVVFFWNLMSRVKCLLSDLLEVPLIDVSPGEMYFKEMEKYLSDPLPELPIRTAIEYGKGLKSAVVKYKSEAAIMRKYLGKPVTVIPNGVEVFPVIKRSFKGPRVFGTAARISPQKRLEDIILAFRGSPHKLLIAGKIELGAEEYAQELKKISGPNVHWLGRQEIKSFLAMLDVFVMVSEPAGCPNASLEALSSGLPVIATDFGGAREQVINNYNGWLIKPRNIAEMKKAIQSAAELDLKKIKLLSKNARKQAARFSISRMAKNYSALI